MHDNWNPLSTAKWHFEHCKFECSRSTMISLNFPWSGPFRFYGNEFDFTSREYPGYLLFVFRTGARILLRANRFNGNNVQTRCISAREGRDSPNEETNAEADRVSGQLSLIGNRGIHELGILEGYSSTSFTGINHIDQLWISGLLEPEKKQIPTVHFGPRERIDDQLHYPLHHRSLFVNLKHMAAMSHDRQQENVLDKQLERIEYFLNREQDPPSILNWPIWIEYWQDRILYGWRRWSSNFYRSWLRPLTMVVLGYLILNALPKFLIEDFSWHHWAEFTLRPIGKVAEYESTLHQMFGSDYAAVSTSNRNLLRIFGIAQTIWITMWSFSFARSIKK